MTVLLDSNQIRERKAAVIARHGEWTAHNMYLTGDLYTIDKKVRGDEILARRILQIAADVTGKPIANLRVLDLACLEGLYALEFARQGAQALGIEVREASIEKARFVRDLLGLQNADFKQDDVRNLTREKCGEFDVVLCLGILYHLDAPDVFDFVHRMAEVCRHLLIIDTHISTTTEESISYGTHRYAGKYFIEHAPNATSEEKSKMLWASIDNDKSFWLTRASLNNLLAHAGFTSVYECWNPPLQEEIDDRLTLVAIKGQPQRVSSPLLAAAPPLEWKERQEITANGRSRLSLARRVWRVLPFPVQNITRKLVR